MSAELLTVSADAVVVGGGPGGLSAAEALASRGASVVVLEQSHEIGSPTRTTGGSFVRDLEALGIPSSLFHPIRRGRFVGPTSEVSFDYQVPETCVMDVRGVFQYLGCRAIDAGARIRLGTTFVDVRTQAGYVTGVLARDAGGRELELRCRVAVDATGYRAALSKKAGHDPGFRRFGVGAEYDLYAPRFDQDEAVLVVGSQIAPAGYAWAFPWGSGRVRVGVGIIHADSRENPRDYLHKLVAEAERYGLDLTGAQPMEYHAGLIPSEGLSARFADNGLLAVGDAAGQASTLVGEGIRWAIKGGRLAGEIAAGALARGDVSRESLSGYETEWRKRHGRNLGIAANVNREIARWSDAQWDRGVEWLRELTPGQFAEAMQSSFGVGWAMRTAASNPRLLARGVGAIAERAVKRGLRT